MAEEPLQYGIDGSVAVIRMDDGKANALSHTMLDALHGALDRAQEDSAAAVALATADWRSHGMSSRGPVYSSSGTSPTSS